MIVISRKLIGARQTGRFMRRLVDSYYGDMAPWASYSLYEIYNHIKNIPFRADPENIEFLQRPYYTMRSLGAGGDCDDKAICLASWAVLNNIPYRFVGVGKRKPGQKPWSKILLTHVYPELYINNNWIIADVTYAFNVLGYSKGYDRRVIL